MSRLMLLWLLKFRNAHWLWVGVRWIYPTSADEEGKNMERKYDTKVLAGMFCVTNMGMPVPDVQTIVNAIVYCKTKNAGSMAMAFAQKYIENEDHVQMFTDECAGWIESLSQKSDAEIERVWPEATAQYDLALEEIK